jgi:septum formation inhibitor MinC
MSKKGETSQQGIALISSLIFLMVIVVLISISLLVSTSNNRLSGDSLRTYQAQLAADAGLQRVIAESWFNSYEASENEDVPDDYQITLEDFRKQLDDAGIIAGETQRGSYTFGDEVVYSEDLEGASYTATVRRVDVGDSYTLLRVDALGFIGEVSSPVALRRLSADMRIQLPQVDNKGFAILSNNSNCMFCHTQVASLETAYDKDGNAIHLTALTTPQQRQTALLDKQRVKMAFLENLLTDRLSDMQSLVAGTIYTRGTTNVVVQGGSLGAIPLKTIDKQTTSLLSSEAPKTLTELDTVNCSSTCTKRHALFYKNYALDNGADGDVPKTFPMLIADANNNRQIEHSEWQSAVSGSSGKLKGGNKKLLTTQNSGNSAFIPTSTTLKDTPTLASSESANGVAGNVILEGTAANPLIIEGDVYINGDVILNGTITGDGKIIARGNIYISGNITYACDDDSQDAAWQSSQSKNCTYNKPDTLPRLGVIAGKNILVGSYMTPATSTKGRPSDQLTRLNFDKTSSNDLATWFVDSGISLETPQTLSYTMVQMSLFNENEYRKAKTNASYIPRFYRLRDDGAIFRCGKGFSASKEDYCKNYAELTNLSASTNTTDISLLSRAAVISATPTNTWLGKDTQSSELAVRAAWVNNVESPRANKALQLDGLYYTPNSIFGNLPISSATQGKLTINGSLAASDIALLTPAGLTINHDERLAEMLETSPTNFVMQTLSNYRLLDADAVVDYGAMRE